MGKVQPVEPRLQAGDRLITRQFAEKHEPDVAGARELVGRAQVLAQERSEERIPRRREGIDLADWTVTFLLGLDADVAGGDQPRRVLSPV